MRYVEEKPDADNAIIRTQERLRDRRGAARWFINAKRCAGRC